MLLVAVLVQKRVPATGDVSRARTQKRTTVNAGCRSVCRILYRQHRQRSRCTTLYEHLQAQEYHNEKVRRSKSLDSRREKHQTLQKIPCAVHTLNVANALCNIQQFKRVGWQMSYTIYACGDSVLQSNGKPKTNANMKPTVLTSRSSATATRAPICSKRLQCLCRQFLRGVVAALLR